MLRLMLLQEEDTFFITAITVLLLLHALAPGQHPDRKYPYIIYKRMQHLVI